MHYKVLEIERRLEQHEARLAEAERVLRTLPAKPSKPLAEARAFLGEVLAAEPRRATDMLRLAKERGISERTLRRAEAAMGAVSFRVSQGPGRGSVSWWRLPSPPLSGCGSAPS
jgi:hypothetical protein